MVGQIGFFSPEIHGIWMSFGCEHWMRRRFPVVVSCENCSSIFRSLDRSNEADGTAWDQPFVNVAVLFGRHPPGRRGRKNVWSFPTGSSNNQRQPAVTKECLVLSDWKFKQSETASSHVRRGVIHGGNRGARTSQTLTGWD